MPVGVQSLMVYPPHMGFSLVITGCIIKVKGQTVQTGEIEHTNRQTDGRYQVHYLPASRSIMTYIWRPVLAWHIAYATELLHFHICQVLCLKMDFRDLSFIIRRWGDSDKIRRNPGRGVCVFPISRKRPHSQFTEELSKSGQILQCDGVMQLWLYILNSCLACFLWLEIFLCPLCGCKRQYYLVDTIHISSGIVYSDLSAFYSFYIFMKEIWKRNAERWGPHPVSPPQEMNRSIDEPMLRGGGCSLHIFTFCSLPPCIFPSSLHVNFFPAPFSFFLLGSIKKTIQVARRKWSNFEGSFDQGTPHAEAL